MREKSFAENQRTVLDKVLENWRANKVKKYIKRGDAVYDLGCGYEGAFLKKIREDLNEGTGLDISVSRDFYDKKIKLKEADLNRRLPLQDCSADAVVSLAVIEHLDDYRGYLKETHRILRNGGTLLVTTPDPKSEFILKILGKICLIDDKEINDHKRYFHPETLMSELKKIGFYSIIHKKFQCGLNNLLIAKK